MIDKYEAPRLLPHLSPNLEVVFRTEYYARLRPTLRVIAPLLSALFMAFAIRDYYDTNQVSLAVSQDGLPAALFLGVFLLTWVPSFGRFWQPTMAAAGLATAILSLMATSAFLTRSGMPSGAGPLTGRELFYGQQMCLLMICLSILRLRLRWAMALQFGVFSIGVWFFLTRFFGADNLPNSALASFLRPVVAILAAVLVTTLVNEQLSIRAFVADQKLKEERNDERHQREQTEGKLHVLAQAIGAIVHDLGNPLTVVQLGSDLLNYQAGTGNTEAIRETSQAIQNGAEMLGALRLSLIEQTRVLEGKPVPVDLQLQSLRPIIEAGAKFQNPKFMYGRTISLIGDDIELYVDRMRLMTVFMNLIGNALKYSDGEVQIAWQTEGNQILIGVLDQGTEGKGISETQARQLFVAFGRLETHGSIEGTGLGLVSARKVVEAHGGEIFVEGYKDRSDAGQRYITALAAHSSLLVPGFVTAFVIACPNAPLPMEKEATAKDYSRPSTAG